MDGTTLTAQNYYGAYRNWTSIFNPQKFSGVGVLDSTFSLANNPTTLPTSLTDPKMFADLSVVKQTATAAGDGGVVRIIDYIFKYGDAALSILSKYGVIENKNLAAAGYQNFGKDPTGMYFAGSGNFKQPIETGAPTGFNLDFSDPKIIIIVALIVLFLIYFLIKN